MAEEGEEAPVAEQEEEPQQPVEVEEEGPSVGKFQFPDGSWYEGDFIVVKKKKRRHGQGMFQDGPELYEGSWVNDAMSGDGKYTFSSGASYTGSFKSGVFEGQGEYTWPDGAVYVGDWRQNKMHGSGVFTDPEDIACQLRQSVIDWMPQSWGRGELWKQFLKIRNLIFF